MAKYRRRVREIFEAFIWTGVPGETDFPDWFNEALEDGMAKIDDERYQDLLAVRIYDHEDCDYEYAEPGDYIARDGYQIHPVNRVVFEKTYEEVKEG